GTSPKRKLDAFRPPEKEIGVLEAHANLAKAVAGSRGVRYFTAFIIDVHSDAYLGDVQIGILLTTHVTGRDAATGEPILTQ
ncbi:hypothetical protein ACC719_36285, partial [Rhizobium ruizarguesonis]